MKCIHLRKVPGGYSGIDPDGKKQAVELGRIASFSSVFEYRRMFVSELASGAETAMAFLTGYRMPLLMGKPVPGLGNTRIAEQIEAGRTPEIVERGLSSWDGLLAAHPLNVIEQWAHDARAGLEQIFAKMEDGETAPAFSHSPIIQLAVHGVWMYGETHQVGVLDPNLHNFEWLEGVALVDDGHKICVADRIPAPTLATA